MNSTKTLDVKNLAHGDREQLIFPGIDALRPGENLRIIVEFNPAPLAYMAKARGDLDVSYEKEGPDEWILRIARVETTENKKQQFRELLTELKSGEASGTAVEKARNLLQEVDAKTLGILEQELIREGVSHDEIRSSLCDIHLEIIKDSLVERRVQVSAPHPVHTLMEEHKIIIASLKELTALTERLRTAETFAAMGDDLEKLKDVSHHLVEAENHHQREEEALFPAIESHDITEPPQIMKMDHVEFRKRKRELYRIAHDHNTLPFLAGC